MSFGEETTREAKTSVEILEKLAELSLADSCFDAKFQFLSLLLRARSRNLSIENVFFKLEWKILQTVRETIKL
jgi:hypothetical protein